MGGQSIRINGHGEGGTVHFPTDRIELVMSHLLEMAGVDEPVAVGVALDEHLRRQVIEVPVEVFRSGSSLAATSGFIQV